VKAEKRVAIVGAGLGGLAAAIRLQRSGLQTKIFEKRDEPGGVIRTVRDQGFTFDAGPSSIISPDCLEELFTAAGRKLSNDVELLPIAPFHRLHWPDGDLIDLTGDVDAMTKEVLKRSPYDGKEFADFLAFGDVLINEAVKGLARHEPKRGWSGFLANLPVFFKTAGFRTIFNTVSQHVRDERVRQALSFHPLLIGASPYAVSSVHCAWLALERRSGLHYPRGGMNSLVNALVKLYKDLGGELKVSAPVAQIETDSRRVAGVRLKSGETWSCDAVVGCASPAHVYGSLLSGEVEANRSKRRSRRIRSSPSAVVVCFGTRKKYDRIVHSNLIVGPRYKEWFDEVFEYGYLPDDFLIHLSCPSATDPSLAPDGGSAFTAVALVPHMGFHEEDWKDDGYAYAEKILAHLEARCLPGLKENLVTKTVFLPRDFESEFNAFQGSPFGAEPVTLQSGGFRHSHRDSRIGGLYFAGANTHPGPGIPAVLSSAKLTAEALLSDLSR
jgi:phytoene desaturase